MAAQRRAASPRDKENHEVSRLLRRALSAPMLVMTLWAAAGLEAGQERNSVTVRQLFDRGHRLEVSAGDEVVWADPHFDRVWFPPGGPAVNRTAEGRVSVFDAAGEYQGRFTVTGGGHGTADVYTVKILVRPRP